MSKNKETSFREEVSENSARIIYLTRVKEDAKTNPNLKSYLDEYFERLEADYDLSMDLDKKEEYEENLRKISEIEKVFITMGYSDK